MKIVSFETDQETEKVYWCPTHGAVEPYLMQSGGMHCPKGLHKSKLSTREFPVRSGITGKIIQYFERSRLAARL